MTLQIDQAPVVPKVVNAIHRINHYPVDSLVCFVNTYPLDSDLSGGAFEHPGPDNLRNPPLGLTDTSDIFSLTQRAYSRYELCISHLKLKIKKCKNNIK